MVACGNRSSSLDCLYGLLCSLLQDDSFVSSDDFYCDSESDSSSPRRHRKRASRKKAKKIAPIFRRAAGDVTDSEDDAPPPVIELTEEEKEWLRIRQAFLRSGVPEELRKQAATQALALASLNYPPLPNREQIHVQQVRSVWPRSRVSISFHYRAHSVDYSLYSVLMCFDESETTNFIQTVCALNFRKTTIAFGIRSHCHCV